MEPSTQTSASDLADLVIRVAQQRDREAFALLYDHFVPRLHGYLFRLGTAGEALEEVVQEAMLAVWRKAAQFDPAKAAVSTWLFQIARNLHIDRLRRQQVRGGNQPTLPIEELELEAPAGDSQPSGDERRLAPAIEALPKLQADVIYASYFLGQSHSEISAALGIPLGTVKSNLRLAFKKLRAQFNVDERGE